MRRVFDQARQVARWNTTVLIRGETGTGKELIANAIHYHSPRSRHALVKLNCAALPENLLETELFGHERGAFTGAVDTHKGRFEQAHGGTLFLDEIGEISSAFQAKLLRVLQEGEFERVGGSRTIRVDVRVIAATHRDLEAAVDAGEFREDLFYRLNVMPLFLPPLRERIEDIPDIAQHLLGKIGQAQGRKLRMTDAATSRLAAHHWPGNVRELETVWSGRRCCRRRPHRRGLDLFSGRARTRQRAPGGSPRPAAHLTPPSVDDPSLSERERVIAALEQAGWVQAKAARLLGMTPADCLSHPDLEYRGQAAVIRSAAPQAAPSRLRGRQRQDTQPKWAGVLPTVVLSDILRLAAPASARRPQRHKQRNKASPTPGRAAERRQTCFAGQIFCTAQLGTAFAKSRSPNSAKRAWPGARQTVPTGRPGRATRPGGFCERHKRPVISITHHAKCPPSRFSLYAPEPAMLQDDLQTVWLTLKLASVVTLLLLLIGTPLAWWLARTCSRARANWWPRWWPCRWCCRRR